MNRRLTTFFIVNLLMLIAVAYGDNKKNPPVSNSDSSKATIIPKMILTRLIRIFTPPV